MDGLALWNLDLSELQNVEVELDDATVADSTVYFAVDYLD